MESPGTMLKAARERRGLTLTEIANITRISRTTLAHLEDDNFDELPAQVFVRGFLRNMARELRLDPLEVIAAYEAHTGLAHRPALENVRRQESPRSPATVMRQSTRPARRTRRILPSWDRVTEVIGSTRPAYVIGSLVVMLVLALTASVLTTSGVSFSEEGPRKATWNVKADGPKARWILDGQNNLTGTARVPAQVERPAVVNEPAVDDTDDDRDDP